ncbi:Calmodulin-binding transcription activator 1 [Acipenser ruthenus]|uniref:Calmodulin-binding transcription activator 1 n=1 Tax=Acipenser ruthenus TaxID=7906 RepID=A0A444UNK4_ACIRT|nr:Calmodulin-binding transcription activator 1 [Acipenser ruthenus]
MFLPNKLLECVPKCTALPKERQRWNTNKNGSIIVYNRKKVKYRNDGYCWKKRKDGKTTREDHMKLKVQGMECLYGCYVHSSIVPTFHRRCYWLLQNPDIVLVHYLNVPASEDGCKVCGPILCSSSSDRREWLKWSKEELICQLRPMCECRQPGRQTDRQTDREAERQTDRQTARQTDREAGRQAGLVKHREAL